MAKFRFYKDTQVITWVRDFYEVEAESQEEAEDIVKTATDIENVGVWIGRDYDNIYDLMSETGTVEIYNEYGEEMK